MEVVGAVEGTETRPAAIAPAPTVGEPRHLLGDDSDAPGPWTACKPTAVAATLAGLAVTLTCTVTSPSSSCTGRWPGERRKAGDRLDQGLLEAFA